MGGGGSGGESPVSRRGRWEGDATTVVGWADKGKGSLERLEIMQDNSAGCKSSKLDGFVQKCADVLLIRGTKQGQASANRDHPKRQEKLKPEKKERTITFRLYLVVVPTARTPFLIALAVRWLSTTWFGIGRMELSSGVAVPSKHTNERCQFSRPKKESEREERKGRIEIERTEGKG